MIDSATTRSMHLIGGRRVQVRDLMDAGLLRPKSALQFVRKRVGETHHAEVTDAGWIRLQPDGPEFPTPSRAAMVASGMRAVDGWLAWTVVETGRSLDTLRQDLLDRAVSVAATVEDGAEEALTQRVHERLREARKRADADQPEEFSVRELISLWGAKGRGDQIIRIEADLANHGLVTHPSFRKVTLDAIVRLIAVPADAEEEVEAPTSTTVISPPEEAEIADDAIGLTVGNLPSALGGINSVEPGATFDEAITKMLLNDHSQLAVLNGKRNLRGAVTWQSIAHARHLKTDAKLSEAIEQDVSDVRYDKELIDALPELQRSGFVFVRNENNEVAGIVTTADVVHAYGEMAMPFFQIGEVDRNLRRIIARNFDLDEVQSFCNRKVSSFDELTMGEYRRVLENPGNWTKLGWPLDRSVLIERLDEIRKIRNDVMHFNPDPPPEGTVEMLRKLNSLLRRYGDQA
ncbi:CBS domain-containing protein [Asanoa sp. NPDC049518]|uniref:restriction system modified-DNA reader domain-containing protein n=1 Tax=unclassified Asanoa TaxID=2685164 RepID=UPI0034327D48